MREHILQQVDYSNPIYGLLYGLIVPEGRKGRKEKNEKKRGPDFPFLPILPSGTINPKSPASNTMGRAK
jgi:hypothetical protein